MTAEEILEQLTALIHSGKVDPKLPIMSQDPDGNYGPFAIMNVKVHTPKKGDYAPEFSMLEGQTFIMMEG